MTAPEARSRAEIDQPPTAAASHACDFHAADRHRARSVASGESASGARPEAFGFRGRININSEAACG